MEEAAHILVVDDDARLRGLLCKYLREHGYLISAAADAAEARQFLASMSFDLIVLDVMMPGEDGVTLTRHLRNNNTVPILLLTAMGETEARIVGLEAGADDYVAKPFEPRELLLRIANVLRRSMRDEPPPSRHCRFGRFVFDLERQELVEAGAIVHLTTGEASLLAVLAASPGQVQSRDDLAARVGLAGNLRTVDVQVTRLRRKIEDDPRAPRYLQTVRGQGYVLWSDGC